MSIDVQKIIKNELSAEENLVWYGRPKPGTIFRFLNISNLFIINAGLLIMALGLSMIISPSKWRLYIDINGDRFSCQAPCGNQYLYIFVTIIFVIFGLSLIFGRFIVDAKRRAKTFYGVTDQRVIIISGLFKKKVKSLNMRTLTDLSLSEKSNREGTISFGQEGSDFWHSIDTGRRSVADIPQFEPIQFQMIPRAKEVYEKIRNVHNKPKET